MTETLVAASTPSSKSTPGTAEDTSALQPDPGGLIARRSVDAGTYSGRAEVENETAKYVA